ncbi:YaiO family outer membrane beta-barrel protein [Pontibacter sp. SGAir0037]|uniref:YaiO family outer membrane beta-barrel protein n=1 Tax=Pontibacter sp. SGAir0037 TaxID=2571030 RepID=UPI0010CCF05F|nr:YaiO family outer membrane beta-barrel protein [Pontibacter sp. SGAir0037]QCR22105.1 hypothetical protein C1N53_06960 [Pontibacter sp. SGAir0037]
MTKTSAGLDFRRQYFSNSHSTQAGKLLLFRKAKQVLFVLCFCIFSATSTYGQTTTPEEKFEQARDLAFNQKNYDAAIRLCLEALEQNPDNADIQVFLGRVYYWNGQPEASLQVLQQAMASKPDYEDAAVAIADISYYQENFTASLSYSEQGLQYHPASRPLMQRKIKALAALTRFQEAYVLTDSLLAIDPSNNQLRSLAEQLRDYSSKSRIGLSYDYTYFDRQFANDWHMISIDYTRQTRAGSVAGRLNYANRYAQSGVQVEAEAYPRISQTFYTYANLGYSPDYPVFPKVRAGFSLFANLPRAFEAEAGFRYLHFENDTWTYTASVGKYYHKFWFNARTYLTPRQNQLSHSYAFTTRYYLKGADDFLSFSIGQGITPDDRSQAVQLNTVYNLQTFRVGAAYHFTIHRLNVVTLSGRYENVEFLPETNGNQVYLAIGYQRRF